MKEDTQFKPKPLVPEEIPENIRNLYDYDSQRLELYKNKGYLSKIERTCSLCGKKKWVFVHSVLELWSGEHGHGRRYKDLEEDDLSVMCKQLQDLLIVKKVSKMVFPLPIIGHEVYA